MDKKLATVLLVDDHLGDRLLVRAALEEIYENIDVRGVKDGVELLDYLCHRHHYEDAALAPRPDLIFLDLTMPRKNGLQALREVKSDAQLSSIPIIVLTGLSAQDLILQAYQLGASSFVLKPISFEKLKSVLKPLCDYWLGFTPTLQEVESEQGYK